MDTLFEPTLVSFLIVCPLLFLSGLVDSIAGGGGLISLPAFMLTGMPMHASLATNKLSSTFGTAVAAARLFRNGLIDLRLALPAVIAGGAESALGSSLSLIMPEALIEKILLFVLPAAAFLVLNKRLFRDNPDSGIQIHSARTCTIVILTALIVGSYDGLYGPGTGSFIIIAFTVFAKMPIIKANGLAKAINLTTNLAALAVFLIHGQAVIALGLAGAACSIAGNYIGTGLAMSKGARIARPVLIAVLALILFRIICGL